MSNQEKSLWTPKLNIGMHSLQTQLKFIKYNNHVKERGVLSKLNQYQCENQIRMQHLNHWLFHNIGRRFQGFFDSHLQLHPFKFTNNLVLQIMADSSKGPSIFMILGSL